MHQCLKKLIINTLLTPTHQKCRARYYSNRCCVCQLHITSLSSIGMLFAAFRSNSECSLCSIQSLAMPDILTMAHNPTSSRVLDVLLESPTVPLQAKRHLVVSFVGSFHLLIDDRIGSRVADRCWAFADTYLKACVASKSIAVLPNVVSPVEKACYSTDSPRAVSRCVILWEVLRAKSQSVPSPAASGRMVGLAIATESSGREDVSSCGCFNRTCQGAATRN